jgi:molecular chaperone GrpE (heat shock protein)
MADSAVAVIQLVDFTTRVARRVKNSVSNTGEVPEHLRETHLHLPLLIATLQQTRLDIESELYSEQTSTALKKLIDESTADICKLEDVLAQTTNDANSKRNRVRRAISGIKHDREVRNITSRLLRTIDGLVLLRTAASTKTPNGVRMGQHEDSGVGLDDKATKAKSTDG